MSDDLYYTVLRWTNGRGIAKGQGMTSTLTEPPDLGGGPVQFLAYRPEIGEADVQMDGERRALTRDEERAADALLRRLTAMPESAR